MIRWLMIEKIFWQMYSKLGKIDTFVVYKVRA